MTEEISHNEILNAIGEILEAINLFSNDTEKRFDEIKTEIGGIKTEIGGMKKEIGTIRALMVTKDYLDDKLGDLRGDLVALIKGEDERINTLVGALNKKDVLTGQESKKIIAMTPFPKLTV